MDRQLLFPERKRCGVCRQFFGFYVIAGLYCSQECAGIPGGVADLIPARIDPATLPRGCRTVRDGEIRAKVRYGTEADADDHIPNNPNTQMNSYRCGHCGYWHVGHKQHPEMKGTYVIRRDKEICAYAYLIELVEGTHILPGSWLVSRIFVPHSERGKGYGSRIIDLVCAEADSRGFVLVLSVEPDSDGHGLGWDELADFYARRGFAYVIDGDPMMRRMPQ